MRLIERTHENHVRRGEFEPTVKQDWLAMDVNRAWLMLTVLLSLLGPCAGGTLDLCKSGDVDGGSRI